MVEEYSARSSEYFSVYQTAQATFVAKARNLESSVWNDGSWSDGCWSDGGGWENSSWSDSGWDNS